MRNDGNVFHDVTAEAGIFSSEIGFGNGLAIADINHDNLPDIYIAMTFGKETTCTSTRVTENSPKN